MAAEPTASSANSNPTPSPLMRYHLVRDSPMSASTGEPRRRFFMPKTKSNHLVTAVFAQALFGVAFT